MQWLFANLRKFTLFSLLCFAFIASACSSGGVTPPTGNDDTTTVAPAATPTQATSQQPTSNNGQTKFVYSGVEITLLSVDQRNKFDNDDSSDKPWTLRVSVKEHNLTNDSVYLFYNDMLRLSLPDGTSIAPQKEGAYEGIDQQVLRDNWYDFPLQQKQDVNKLALHFGQTTDYQYIIPLSRNPNLSQYNSHSVTLNKKMRYAGLDWTLTKATAQFYYQGKQATAGHRYIILDFTVDNTTSDSYYPFPTDYFRLKSQNVTQAPENSTLPAS